MRKGLLTFTIILFTFGSFAQVGDYTGTYTHNPSHTGDSDLEIGHAMDDDNPILTINWKHNEIAMSAQAQICTDCDTYIANYGTGNVIEAYTYEYKVDEMNITCYLLCTQEANGSYTFVKVEEFLDGFSYSSSIYQLTAN